MPVLGRLEDMIGRYANRLAVILVSSSHDAAHLGAR